MGVNCQIRIFQTITRFLLLLFAIYLHQLKHLSVQTSGATDLT